MAKTFNKDEMQVFKADLHIHTPASKCYKGSKDDAEYIRIIEKAEEKGLKIIAITDHNSIEGYEKLIEQKERIRVEVEGFKTLNDSKEAKKKIKEGERTLKIFDSILILPGVEFEVNNGIHMLVIFNPESDLTIIKEFLKNGGFDADSFGKEDEVFSKWSLFELYNESKKYDCLVLDAHTDSNKGIYNTIRGGTPRIHAFIDKALVGICYKSEKQKSEILKLFSQPNYRRTNPIAFLKSSDAHRIEDIGKEKTYFRLRKLGWDDLKSSFNNPDECIFTSNPSIQTIINRISNTGRCIYISELNDSYTDEFAKSICGLSNANGGYIILGADSKDVVNGIEIKNKEDLKNVSSFIDNISTNILKGHLPFNIYPLKDDCCIVIVKVDESDELVDANNDGVIYYYKKGDNVKLTANQIQQIISQRIDTKYQEHISKELTVVRKSLSAIETYLKSQPLLSAYSKISTPISDYVSSFDVQEPIKLLPEQKITLIDRSQEHGNGFFKGNIMFIDVEQSPRLKNACLRITPPKFTLKGIKKISDKKHLYIVPGGAVFYSESELNYYNNDGSPFLKIEVSESYSIKFLCAFLKSSFFLWYVKNKFGDLNIYLPEIFNYINVPSLHNNNVDEKNIIQKIESNVDDIIELEKAFLKTDMENIKDVIDYVNQHNEQTKKSFKEIDELIFNLLRISEDDILIIKENLRANNIYIPE